MVDIRPLFSTPLYRARLSEHGPVIDPAEMEASCYSIAEDDAAGQAWCEENSFALAWTFVLPMPRRIGSGPNPH